MTAAEYRWSSAAMHCGISTDPLLTALPSGSEFIADWAAWLRDKYPVEIEMLRQRTHTGRPMGYVWGSSTVWKEAKQSAAPQNLFSRLSRLSRLK